MKNKTIAVDVDLVAVDTLTPWLLWFKDLTGRDVENKGGYYDLVPEMLHIIAEERMYFDPYSFWKQPDLYDELVPVSGCQKKLLELYMNDHDIIFVSVCNSNHLDSKIRFIKRFFPYYSAFIDTEHKQFIQYDVFIDDKFGNIEAGYRRNPHAKHYLMTQISRGYVSYEEPTDNNFIVLNHWNDLPSSF